MKNSGACTKHRDSVTLVSFEPQTHRTVDREIICHFNPRRSTMDEVKMGSCYVSVMKSRQVYKNLLQVSVPKANPQASIL